MDDEVALVSAMISRGDVDVVEAEGIEEQHFVDDQVRAVFKSVVEHTHLWRKPPSVEAVRKMHPEFRLRAIDDRDETGYLAQEFISLVTLRAAQEKWRDLQVSIDDPSQRHRLAEVFSEHARDMALLVPTPRMSRFSDMAKRIVVMRKEQEEGFRPGIDLGFSHADSFIRGVRNTEVVVFLGYTNIGKTQGLIRATHNGYLQNTKPPMFVSLEMEQEELYEKWDSMAAGVSSMAMRARELKPEDYDKLQIAAEKAANSSSDIIIIDELKGAATVDRIAALAERYKPGIIAVDYISLMTAHREISSDWERVTHISRALKQLARALKVPVYAAAQSNRQAEAEGPTLDNIAYSLSIGQDANIAIGFHQTPDDARLKKVEVRLLKNRNGPKGVAYERWDRDRMIFDAWGKDTEWLGKLELERAEEQPAPARHSPINMSAFAPT